MSNTQHSASSTVPVRLGFIPLLDAAPLIVARELGFFDMEGVDVRLYRESSWASLRDRVSVGMLDGGQMLGPMALAANLGLGAPASHLIAPLVLSRNGNAITARRDLYDQLLATGYDLSRPQQAAQALAHHLKQREQPLHLGIVYAWSSHYLQLRDWLATADLHPGRQLKLVTVPPAQMVNALSTGDIDIACVGEPWNSLAEHQALGHILVTGNQIWQNAPEKVLGLKADWAEQNPATVHCLMVALIRACQWLDDPQNRTRALDILALPAYLGQAIQPLGEAGQVLFHPRVHQHFHRQCANFPWLSQAQWLLSRMTAWGQLPMDRPEPDLQAIYRPELYREAASVLGLDAPVMNFKQEGTHDSPFVVAGQRGPIQVASDSLINQRELQSS